MHGLLLMAAVVLVGFHHDSAKADETIDVVLAATTTINNAGRDSQGRIDKIANETQTLVNQYRTVLKELEGLRVYNEQQRIIIRGQEQEMQELNNSIDNVTVIERQITPLMIRMLDGLEKFIELDVPFLLEEREERIERLRDTLDRSDVSVSEKFSAILNAYQIENEYGRTMEAYNGTLSGTDKEVDFLRFGRVALVYQTKDGAESGNWNHKTRQFELLDDSYNAQIRNGIRMARKQAAVDVVILPVQTPDIAQ